MADLNAHAYAVAYIDTTTGKVVGVGLFSEDEPTMMRPHFAAVIYQVRAETYAAAAAMVADRLDNDPRFNRWLERASDNPRSREAWVVRGVPRG